jgi:DNA topoisomerase-2
MLMTDQDVDGMHIKGLFLNVIDCQFNSLLKLPDYIRDFQTPIVTATKGNVVKDYYTIDDFNSEKEKLSGFTIKYKKGLGTNTSQEAKKYFKELDVMIRYFQYDSEAQETMEKIFKKDKANERKDWLSKYDKKLCFKPDVDKQIPVSEFCNKELIHFSNYDNIRSIPRCEDGLKPSHRKIIYCVNKRNWSSELKVAQLAGYVAEHSAYHHGEQSLMQAIIGLAQNFVGSNNLNLLKPNGQFGTRLLGGADAASPRYIFTEPMEYFYDIFHKDDRNLLDYLDDDGTQIEPEYYMPVIPLELVNGIRGIGTGWSTEIPAYNPFDIINNIKKLINEETPDEMIPWYRGFKGEIKISEDSKKAIITGKYTLNGDSLTITELPVGTWSDKYKEYLESLLESKVISDYRWYCTDTEVKIIVSLTIIPDDIIKKFKLSDTVNLTNMHMYDTNGRIHKYQDVLEVLQEYYQKRLEYYQKRKDYLLDKYHSDITLESAKARFVKDIIDEKVIVFRKSNIEIVKQLKEHKYPEIDSGYRYLLSMAISSFTKEKIAELEESVKNLEKLITTLESKSPGDIWIEDLEILEKKIQDYYSELDLEIEEEKTPEKGKGKVKSKGKSKSKK